MKHSAHPERQSAFQQATVAIGLIHGTIRPGCPWQNGIIERSNRTDNEELFNRERFTEPEERRYRLRLWEYEYNTRRPHQGLGGRTPLEVFETEYRLHAAGRMLM